MPAKLLGDAGAACRGPPPLPLAQPRCCCRISIAAPSTDPERRSLSHCPFAERASRPAAGLRQQRGAGMARPTRCRCLTYQGGRWGAWGCKRQSAAWGDTNGRASAEACGNAQDTQAARPRQGRSSSRPSKAPRLAGRQLPKLQRRHLRARSRLHKRCRQSGGGAASGMQPDSCSRAAQEQQRAARKQQQAARAKEARQGTNGCI